MVADPRARFRVRGLLELAEQICAEHHVTVEEIVGRSRVHHIYEARVAVWRALLDTGWTPRGVADLFERDTSTVTRVVPTVFPSLCSAKPQCSHGIHPHAVISCCAELQNVHKVESEESRCPTIHKAVTTRAATVPDLEVPQPVREGAA